MSPDQIRDLGEIVRGDLIDLFVGDLIGYGASREVYQCAFDETLVVKIEKGARSFSNVHEWQVWCEVQYWDERKAWFAPCHAISSCGSVLLQKRTKPLKAAPKQVPNFLTDLKLENFGSYQGRPVAHDYGLTMLLTRGFRAPRMITPRWYS